MKESRTFTIISFAVAGLLFILLETALIAFADRPASEYLHTLDLQHHTIIDFFRSWTNLGKAQWYLWPSGLGMIICLTLSQQKKIPLAQRREWLRCGRAYGFFFACVAVSGIVTDIIKPLAGRARPVLLQRENFYGFHPFTLHTHDTLNSLPSGHTTTAFAVAFALMVLQPRCKGWPLLFAVALAVSRVMVNAHYVSDVIAGALVGTVTVVVVREIFCRRGWLVVNFPRI